MKTTKAQFEQFKGAFLKYQELLGLQQYKVYFTHEKDDDNFATIRAHPESAAAEVNFGAECGKIDLPFLDPSGSGKHEAMHLLLAKIRYLADKRYCMAREIDEEDEFITRVLEKVIP
jgi:hypothetical protein